jgi:hypothetical protein
MERPTGVAHLGLTDALWEMIEDCWSSDPNARPSLDDILAVLPPDDV